MDDAILITELNDFIFCPVSIYFHNLYGSMERVLYQCSDQLNGTAAHEAVDTGRYSDKQDIMMGTDVYCEKYRLIGKIDIFDKNKGVLRERKKKISTVYPGYIFQVYAQYFALKEMGYDVKRIELYSIDTNKTFLIPLPTEDLKMLSDFEKTIAAMRNFDMETFTQDNVEKCRHCIYEPSCDRTLLEV